MAEAILRWETRDNDRMCRNQREGVLEPTYGDVGKGTEHVGDAELQTAVLPEPQEHHGDATTLLRRVATIHGGTPRATRAPW